MFKKCLKMLCLQSMIFLEIYSMKEDSLEWIQQAKILIGSKKHNFVATDKQSNPVFIKLEAICSDSPGIKNILERFSDTASRAFTKSEVQFLRAFPNLVFSDEHYKEFIPCFEKGINYVNWQLVEEKMHAQIKCLFGKAPTVFLALNLYVFGEIINKETQALLGVISFGVTPAMNYGEIKLTNVAIIPEFQKRGLGKLLISCIFKLIPKIGKIFLTVRPTNEEALCFYRQLGFIQNPKKQDGDKFFVLEYLADKFDLLQKTSEGIGER